MIKRNVQPPPTNNAAQNPTTHSYVYMRIQPFMTFLPTPQHAGAAESQSITQSTLQFILYLTDPEHQITHSSVTQTIPAKWLELWDSYEWVEDLVVEVIRVGVETIGQEYIVSRMGWDKKGEDTKAEVPQPTETKAE
jgi:hypothetical protein